MVTIITQDPRSPLRFSWIDHYRKVKPVLLSPPYRLDTDNLQVRGGGEKVSTAGLTPYSGPWGSAQVRHLISRTLFGVKKTDLLKFQRMSMNEAVDTIITPSEQPRPPVNDYEGIDDGAKDPHVGLGQSWLYAPHAGDQEGLRVVSLKTWLISNILNQDSNIHEKMVLFWSNILVTKLWDVYIAKASYRYYEMLYRNALGNYKTMIRQLTLDPSMLLFLNGAANTKEAPDENYARELQELFCVGKGPDSKYTEGDVQAAARILTGWTIDWQPFENIGTFASQFIPENHDTSDKQFSSFYNNRMIKGRPGRDGAVELDELLDMLFDNLETARYICWRIYSFFVSNAINETVERNVIQPLAEIFRSNNFEIAPVLKTLLKSEHFYDALNQGVLIKSPADHLLGLWRTMGVRYPGNGPVHKHIVHRSMLWHMSGLGMEIGDPPNVAGWTPYYQAPQFDKAWITTDTITRRAITTDSLLYWGFWISPEIQINVDILAFVRTFGKAEDPNLLLQEAADLLLGLELSSAVRDHLKTVLLSGQRNDGYWTAAWRDYILSPGDGGKEQIVRSRLQATFQQLLQFGEYHLM